MKYEYEQNVALNGPAAAAFVAAGVGCLALGFFTSLAEISAGSKSFLNWWNPAGPLTGKTSIAIIVWLLVWIVLHLLWKGRDVKFGEMFGLSLFLVALGFVGTFPTFFEMFSH